jgi:hypothetical protein
MIRRRAATFLLVLAALLLGTLLADMAPSAGSALPAGLAVEGMAGGADGCDDAPWSASRPCPAGCTGGGLALAAAPALPSPAWTAGRIEASGAHRSGRDPAPEPKPPKPAHPA